MSGKLPNPEPQGWIQTALVDVRQVASMNVAAGLWLLYKLRTSDRKTGCWLSTNDADAKMIGCSERQVQRARQKLIDQHLIEAWPTVGADGYRGPDIIAVVEHVPDGMTVADAVRTHAQAWRRRLPVDAGQRAANRRRDAVRGDDSGVDSHDTCGKPDDSHDTCGGTVDSHDTCGGTSTKNPTTKNPPHTSVEQVSVVGDHVGSTEVGRAGVEVLSTIADVYPWCFESIGRDVETLYADDGLVSAIGRAALDVGVEVTSRAVAFTLRLPEVGVCVCVKAMTGHVERDTLDRRRWADLPTVEEMADWHHQCAESDEDCYGDRGIAVVDGVVGPCLCVEECER